MGWWQPVRVDRNADRLLWLERRLAQDVDRSRRVLVGGASRWGWLIVQIQARDRRHLLEWAGDLRLLDGEEFEWLVGELFRREGWAVTERGRQDSADGNIDLTKIPALVGSFSRASVPRKARTSSTPAPRSPPAQIPAATLAG